MVHKVLKEILHVFSIVKTGLNGTGILKQLFLMCFVNFLKHSWNLVFYELSSYQLPWFKAHVTAIAWLNKSKLIKIKWIFVQVYFI